MDRGAWQATVHGVAKSWTQLSDQAQAQVTLQSIGHMDVILSSLQLAEYKLSPKPIQTLPNL